MRLFFIVSVIIVPVSMLAASQQSPPPTPSPSKSSEEQQQISGSKADKNSRDHANSQPPASAANNPPVGDASADNKRNRGTTDWVVFFTAVLAGVAILQVIVAVLQFYAMNKQAAYMQEGLLTALRSAEAANKSADAAGKNADALINAERAWVMAEIDWTDSTRVVEQATSDGAVRSGAHLTLTCKNDGRTPAWITVTQARMQIADHVPVFEEAKKALSSEGAKGGSLMELCTEPLNVAGTLTREFWLQCDGKLASGKVVVYGCVTYRDIFNPKRTTWFGYTINRKQELRRIVGVTGLAGYNEST
jgi:hypothetical protein